jgi:hypothetical protein
VANRDGWRDPHLRRLRTVAFVVLSALLVWVVVVEAGPNDLGATGTLGGMLLVLLGFEALVRWPPQGPR